MPRVYPSRVAAEVARVDMSGTPILRHRAATGWDPGRPAVVHCMGFGWTLVTALSAEWWLHLLLATGWTIYTPDGGYTWGTNTAAVDHARSRAIADGHGGDVMLYGTSMGACTALNWAWRNPARTLGAWLLVPVYDIPSLWGRDPLITLSLAGTFGVVDQAALVDASADWDPIRHTADIAPIADRIAAHAVVDDELIDYGPLADWCAGLGVPLTSSPSGGHAGATSGTFDEWAAARTYHSNL